MITLTNHGPMIRSDLCEKARIPWTTAVDSLQKLEKNNIVEQYKDPKHHGVGRPRVYWRMKKTKGGNTIGVD